MTQVEINNTNNFQPHGPLGPSYVKLKPKTEKERSNIKRIVQNSVENRARDRAPLSVRVA